MGVIDRNGNQHRAGGTPGGGRFTGRGRPPASSAGLSDAPAPWRARATALSAEYHDLFLDKVAWETVRAAGEMPSGRERLAATSEDPAVLAALSGDTISAAGQRLAMNPATPACVLHDIATDRRSGRRYEDRAAALMHPNTDVATLEMLSAPPEKADRSADALRREVAHAPNATGEMLTRLLYDDWSEAAGQHPNLPADVLDSAVHDPERAHLVISNPQLSDRQLRESLDVFDGYRTTDDDCVWAEVVAARVARHPNASTSTVQELAHHPDAHVRKTARERLTAPAAKDER